MLKCTVTFELHAYRKETGKKCILNAQTFWAKWYISVHKQMKNITSEAKANCELTKNGMWLDIHYFAGDNCCTVLLYSKQKVYENAHYPLQSTNHWRLAQVNSKICILESH